MTRLDREGRRVLSVRSDIPPGLMTSSLSGRPRAARRFQWTTFLALAAIALLVDQALKHLLPASGAPAAGVDLGPLSLTHVHNSGIAFGFFPSATSVITIATAGAVAGLVVYFARAGASHPLLPVALGLLGGGSLSNLVDRARLGYVTDYLQLLDSPAFNAADAFIIAGIATLLVGEARSAGTRFR